MERDRVSASSARNPEPSSGHSLTLALSHSRTLSLSHSLTLTSSLYHSLTASLPHCLTLTLSGVGGVEGHHCLCLLRALARLLPLRSRGWSRGWSRGGR